MLRRADRYDDSLDAFGVHGVGGLAGALLTGVFAEKALNAGGADGALFGNPRQLALQAVACATTGLYAAVATFGILKAVDALVGLRVTESEEREGLICLSTAKRLRGRERGMSESEGERLRPPSPEVAAQ